MSEESQDRDSCDRCGKEALGVIGEELLSENCIHAESACCGGFS